YSAITPAAASASIRAASQVQYRDREGASRRRVSATPRGPAPRLATRPALLGDYARGGQRIDRAASQDQYRDREGASRRRVSATPRGPAPRLATRPALLGDYARGGQRIDRAASQDQYRDREGASRRRVSATPRGPARGWPRAPGTTRRLRPRRRAHRP